MVKIGKNDLGFFVVSNDRSASIMYGALGKQEMHIEYGCWLENFIGIGYWGELIAYRCESCVHKETEEV
jgi:hypothetical protein